MDLELVLLASAAALAWAGLTGLPLAAYTWWAAVGVGLLFVDLAVRRLPARLSYTAAGGLLTLLLVAAWLGHAWAPWIRAAGGVLVAAAVLAGCALAFPTLVGRGDVRYALAVSAAAWVGWLTLYAAAFLATSHGPGRHRTDHRRAGQPAQPPTGRPVPVRRNAIGRGAAGVAPAHSPSLSRTMIVPQDRWVRLTVPGTS